MSYSTDPSARASFIGDLRALADFLDRHPAIPVPLYGECFTLHAASTDDGGRDQVNHVACLLGATIIDEIASGGHYRAERAFGQITYSVVSIPEAHMAAYHALNSYDGCVSPDTP
jgi:hypothetical protein